MTACWSIQVAADIFAKFGDIKGESFDDKHKDESRCCRSRGEWPIPGPSEAAVTAAVAARARRPSTTFLHAQHRQGVAAAAEGVRDRQRI